MTTLITYATGLLNREINVVVEDEKIEYIDTEKKNYINGSNTVYYTKHTPLGDYDNDGDVDTSDFYVYNIDSAGTRTAFTVSAVNDPWIGKITLATAPASATRLYITYAWAPLREDSSLHPLIKLACMQLTAALAYKKLHGGIISGIRIGKIALTSEPQTYHTYMSEYYRTISQIIAKAAWLQEGQGFSERD